MGMKYCEANRIHVKLVDTCVPVEALEYMLIIGGIEPNPGPKQPNTEVIDKDGEYSNGEDLRGFNVDDDDADPLTERITETELPDRAIDSQSEMETIVETEEMESSEGGVVVSPVIPSNVDISSSAKSFEQRKRCEREIIEFHKHRIVIDKQKGRVGVRLGIDVDAEWVRIEIIIHEPKWVYNLIFTML